MNKHTLFKRLTFRSFSKTAFATLLFFGLFSISHTAQAGKTASSRSYTSSSQTCMDTTEQLAAEQARITAISDSILDKLGILGTLPREARTQFAENMTLPELLETHKNAGDIHKAVLQTGPALVSMIPEQFYQAIERLFTITQDEDGSWKFTANDLNKKIRNFQEKILMQVLRALHDHTYYGISDKIYQEIITRLKDHDWWENGILQAIYQVDSKHFHGVVMGQVLNHLDEGERKLDLIFGEKPKKYSAPVINIIAELALHKNKGLTPNI